MTRRDRHRNAQDPPGFREFVSAHGDALMRFAAVLATDVAAGEDMYQEALQRLAANWATVDHPGAYARVVLRNLAVDRDRARRRRPREVPMTDVEPSDSRSSDPMTAAELRPALFAALATLTADQRMVVALRYLEDRSEADVAALAGVPVGTIKSTASRAISRLRRDPSIAHLFAAEAAG